jgi:hypothetical protein
MQISIMSISPIVIEGVLRTEVDKSHGYPGVVLDDGADIMFGKRGGKSQRG